MTFRFQTLCLAHFRGFEHFALTLEDDLTLIAADAGNCASTLLTALAAGLAPFQAGVPRALMLTAKPDADGGRAPARQCSLAWTAVIGDRAVTWSTTLYRASHRRRCEHDAAFTAIEQLRAPGACWPLFSYYGAHGIGRGAASTTPVAARPDRWEGYAGSLDPAHDDRALLTWLLEEFLADAVHRQHGEPERSLATAVMNAAATAAPGVARIWYDPSERGPLVGMTSGAVVPWTGLPDDLHAYLALVIDLARRAVMLNQQARAHAMSTTQGVVLIDEIERHLPAHMPSAALANLRTAFPRLQFIMTTRSPQVLRSAPTRHARSLERPAIP